MKKLVVLITSLIVAATFSNTAAAAEWNFYGSARMATFVSDTDDSVGNDTTTLNHSLQGNARIGANVNVNDAVQARFEYGSSVNLRQLWGSWNFGSGALLVGQAYTPLYVKYSGQVFGGDRGLNGYGSVDNSRKPQIKLTFGDFQIAAIQPMSSTHNAAVGSFTEVTFPKIEAKYDFNFNHLKISVAAGFNTYELTDSATGIAHDVDSYIIAFGGKVNFGVVYLGGNFYIGENIGSYGMSNSPDDDPTISGNNLNDNDGYGFSFVFGAKFNDMISFEGGYGWTEAELDTVGSNEDDAQSYYLQSTITFAPGVFIVPEIGVVDEKQDATGSQENETVYYGLKWQINF